MTGLTNFITDRPWPDILLVWFVFIDDAYQALERHYGRWRRCGSPPVFSDSEVITVALFIDTVFHGDEALGLSFLRQYHAELFPRLLPNGQFNARRRALRAIMEQIRRYLNVHHDLIRSHDPHRLLDSAPIFVCTYGRAKACWTVQGAETFHEYFGLSTSRKAKVFGYRLQLTVTPNQMVDEWGLVPAGWHDSQALEPAVTDSAARHILADGAFNNPAARDHLAGQRGVQVWAVPRRDSRQSWPGAFRRLVTRVRRRVETALSVLTTVFHIEHPRARSFSGIISRITTRLLAYTLCFLMEPQLAPCETPT